MARSFKGIPPVDPDWETHPDVFTDPVDGTQWHLAMRIKSTGAQWVCVKLYAVTPVPHKGNFSLYWSHEESRWAKSREAMLLDQHRPDLRELVHTALEMWWLRVLAERREGVR